jgi:hypothetical protein
VQNAVSSETSVYTRSTRRHIPENGILLTYSTINKDFQKTIAVKNKQKEYLFSLDCVKIRFILLFSIS